MATVNALNQTRSVDSRKSFDRGFQILCFLVASLAIVILVTLDTAILAKGGGWLSWSFLVSNHRENLPEQSGVGQAIIGSIVVCLICGLAAMPIGIATAVFLEEYQPLSRLGKLLHGFIQLNVSNLAGVPSIVYGILGVTAFVYMFGWFGQIQANKPPPVEIGASYFYQTKTLGKKWVQFPATDRTKQVFVIESSLPAVNELGQPIELNVIDRSATAPTEPELRDRTVYSGATASILATKRPWYFHLPFSKCVFSAGLTLALVILPIVIIAAQEAIRAVPSSLREAAYGLGANKWQVVSTTVLPSALPGIMTGAILAMSRAIGEAAPLLAVMGGVISTTNSLGNLMDKSPVLPVTIYRWAQDENPAFENLAAAAIIVLLIFLLLMNSVAIFVRNRAERKHA